MRFSKPATIAAAITALSLAGGGVAYAGTYSGGTTHHSSSSSSGHHSSSHHSSGHHSTSHHHKSSGSSTSSSSKCTRDDGSLVDLDALTGKDTAQGLVDVSVASDDACTT
jgi:hypothetical protein